MEITKLTATVVNKIAVLKDINGNKIIPMTLTKAVQDDTGKKLNVILDEKLNTTKVVNTNTSIETDGNVLNAVQANPNVEGSLANQINDCLKRSIATKTSTATKIVDILECGVYSIVNGASQFTDYPTKLINDGLLYGELVVSKNTYIVYELTVFNSNYGNVTKMYGVKNNNTLLIDWQPIATTTKTPFSCTANTGVTISQQDCYIENGEFTLTLTASITNGTSFSENIVAILPFTPKTLYVGNAMGRTDLTTSAWLKKVNCYCDTGKNIAVTTEDSTIKQVLLTIKGGVA